MTRRRQMLLAWAAASVAATAAAGLASAAPGPAQAVLHTEVEASYWTLDCGTPIGCGGQVAPPSDPYPAHTLHVAAAAGTPTQTTYILLDTGILPATARIATSTLVLPVATDSQAGSVNASAATLEICRTTESFAADDFNTAPPPSVSCLAKATATYHTSPQPAFTADLGPLLAATNGSLTDVGLAILPTPGTTGTWQVALNGQDRNVAGQLPITAAVTYEDTADLRLPTGVPASRSVAAPGSAHEPPGAPPPAPAASLPLPEAGASPALPPALAPAGPASRPAASARLIPAGQYGMVWAVPLGLLGLGWLAFATVRRDLRSAAWR